MKIFITAKAGARENKIRRIDDRHLAVWVKERPQKGKANEAIVKAIANYLGVPRSRVTLLHGKASKRKVVEVQ